MRLPLAALLCLRVFALLLLLLLLLFLVALVLFSVLSFLSFLSFSVLSPLSFLSFFCLLSFLLLFSGCAGAVASFASLAPARAAALLAPPPAALDDDVASASSSAISSSSSRLTSSPLSTQEARALVEDAVSEDPKLFFLIRDFVTLLLHEVQDTGQLFERLLAKASSRLAGDLGSATTFRACTTASWQPFPEKETEHSVRSAFSRPSKVSRVAAGFPANADPQADQDCAASRLHEVCPWLLAVAGQTASGVAEQLKQARAQVRDKASKVQKIAQALPVGESEDKYREAVGQPPATAAV